MRTDDSSVSDTMTSGARHGAGDGGARTELGVDVRDGHGVKWPGKPAVQ
jgi:hypothetical protein